MAKPEIRAVKKNSNKSKESSQKQETKNNESPSQKQAQPDESSSEPASSSNCQSSSSETLQKPDEQKKESAEANRETSNQEATTRFFQAIGVIEGEVSFDEQGQAKVTLNGKDYPLLYIPKQKYKLSALQKHINQTGNAVKRLVVYPRAIHFPDKETPQQIQFQLLRFEQGETRLGVSQELDNMEFQFAGFLAFRYLRTSAKSG